MPTAPPLTRPSARPGTNRVRVAVAVIAGLAAAIALFFVTSSMLAGPERVDLTIENPTAFPLRAEVSDASGGSVQGLGPISSESTRDFAGVLDQGETWVFTFSYGDVVAAEITVDRARVQSGPISIPDTADQTLRDAGLPPQPTG